jgi:hypothetical protein
MALSLSTSLSMALAVGLGGGATAQAQSLSLDPITARAIAHAGAGLVADDSAAVWWQNPAAAARREAARVVLGMSSVDTDLEIEPRRLESAPTATSRANSGVSPQLSLVATWRQLSFGVSLLAGQRQARRFEGPPPGIAVDEANRIFSLRYAGLSGAIRRDTLNVGVARRLTDSLAVGLSVGGSRVSFRESRRVWAGIEALGDSLLDPQHDLELSMSGSDDFIPTASAGAVLVPEDSALELAVGLSAVAPIDLAGQFSSSTSSSGAVPLRGQLAASMALPAQWVLRLGARWQGERWSIEGNGQLEWLPGRARALRWQLDDARFLHRSGVTGALDELPSQLSLRSLATLRAAADVEVIEGLLWLSAGGGWSAISTSSVRLAPGFSELGGVTGAFGAEISAGGVTVALGVSRAWSPPRHAVQTVHQLGNPFASYGAGPAGSSGTAGTGYGDYRSAIDLIGISVEIEQR